MKKYTTILFDLDNTLLDFDSDERNALITTLNENHIPQSERILSRYSEINSALWREFEKGAITKEDIKNTRFKRLMEDIGIICDKTPRQINDCYANHLTEGGILFDGAMELCKKLNESGRVIYIVTNGIELTQQKRMARSGLDKVVKDVFISEKIGYQKPMKEYFDFVLKNIDEKDKSKIILIGDSLSSDITGAINAGIDCIWINKAGVKNTYELSATYEVSDLEEAGKILL